MQQRFVQPSEVHVRDTWGQLPRTESWDDAGMGTVSLGDLVGTEWRIVGERRALSYWMLKVGDASTVQTAPNALGTCSNSYVASSLR